MRGFESGRGGVSPARGGASGVFILLAVFASAFPLYDFFTLFKILLLCFSLLIIVKVGGLNIIKDSLIFFASIYAVFLMFFIKEWDEFTYRIIFNQIVLLVAALASRYVIVTGDHLKLSIIICLLFLLYSLLFNVNQVDGKTQSHAQILTLVFLVMITARMELLVNANTLFLLILLSKVRSVLIGYIPVLTYFYLFKHISISRYALITIPTFIVIFILMVVNVEAIWIIAGDSFDSFSWRVVHWGNLIGEFTTKDLLFGKGLGYSWRETLMFNNFYTDGENYIATHSNYVKIIADTGLVGLAAFFVFIVRIFISSPDSVRMLIIVYLIYGLFDEGLWMYNFSWLVFLGFHGKANVNNNSR